MSECDTSVNEENVDNKRGSTGNKKTTQKKNKPNGE